MFEGGALWGTESTPAFVSDLLLLQGEVSSLLLARHLPPVQEVKSSSSHLKMCLILVLWFDHSYSVTLKEASSIECLELIQLLMLQ